MPFFYNVINLWSEDVWGILVWDMGCWDDGFEFFGTFVDSVHSEHELLILNEYFYIFISQSLVY